MNELEALSKELCKKTYLTKEELNDVYDRVREDSFIYIRHTLSDERGGFYYMPTPWGYWYFVRESMTHPGKITEPGVIPNKQIVFVNPKKSWV